MIKIFQILKRLKTFPRITIKQTRRIYFVVILKNTFNLKNIFKKKIFAKILKQFLKFENLLIMFHRETFDK